MARPSTRILSRERIARAALRLVAQHGEFTIPELAAALGVHASSLYHHMPGGRRAIVHEMRVEVYAGIDLSPLLDRSRPALERLEGWMRATRDATAAVPAVLPVIVGAPVEDARTLDIYEALFRILRDARLPEALLVPCSALVDAVVLGSALDAASPVPLWRPDASAHPELRSIAAADGPSRSDAGFELAIAAVLAQVELLAR